MESLSGKFTNIIRVNAQERFLSKLNGVERTLEQKTENYRKTSSSVYVFDDEAAKLHRRGFPCTRNALLPDIIESGTKNSANHQVPTNVGGLPQRTCNSN